MSVLTPLKTYQLNKYFVAYTYPDECTHNTVYKIMPPKTTKIDRIASLREQIICPPPVYCSAISAGLQKILPEGLRRGTVVEYLGNEGAGATSLALLAACEACGDQQALAIIDQEQFFYPPTVMRLAIQTEVIFITPSTQRELQWSLTQSLSCSGVGAVLCWPKKLDPREFRILQLVAEKGNSLGLLVRPTEARSQPSWSDVQLLVESIPTKNERRRIKVEILRNRNGNTGASVEIEFDDENPTIH